MKTFLNGNQEEPGPYFAVLGAEMQPPASALLLQRHPERMFQIDIAGAAHRGTMYASRIHELRPTRALDLPFWVDCGLMDG